MITRVLLYNDRVKYDKKLIALEEAWRKRHFIAISAIPLPANFYEGKNVHYYSYGQGVDDDPNWNLWGAKLWAYVYRENLDINKYKKLNVGLLCTLFGIDKDA